MAYIYKPPGTPPEEDPRLKPQPAATVPDPANDGDPYRRNSTAVPGNVETRYGAVAPPAGPVGQPPPKAATPDAFAPSNAALAQRQLLVPSTAQAEVPPPSIQPVPAAVTPLAPGPTAAAAAPVIPPVTTGPTPIPGTLPGAQPQANGQPVVPQPLTDDEDAYRRRLAVA